MMCNWCGKKLPKGRRRFCCNKHKDKYHNHINPRGMYAHLGREEPKMTEELRKFCMTEEEIYDYEPPFDENQEECITPRQYHDSVHPFDSEAGVNQ